MVRTALVVLALTLAIGCENPASGLRAEEDEAIGTLETASFRLEIADGLGHVRAHSAEEVVIRASAAELAITLIRRDPALTRLRLRLWNLPPGFLLRSAPGVLTVDGEPSAGVADAELHLGTSWEVQFPEGVDQVLLITPPRAPEEFTFLAFGDIQNGIDRFHEVVEAVNQEPNADFILMLGDLSSRAKTPEFDAVEAAYADTRFPIYATIGNHDVDTDFEYQARFGRVNYSFLHKGMRFTSLDSASADLSTQALDRWREWAEAGAGQLHAVFSHIPAIDRFGIRSGQWNSRRQAHRFLSLASEHAVDLLLYGHIHSFDEYELAGIPTYISGGCGAFEERLDGIGRHYLRIRVRPVEQTFDVEVVRVDPE